VPLFWPSYIGAYANKKRTLRVNLTLEVKLVLKKVIASFLVFILCFGVLQVSAQGKSEYYSYAADLWIDNQLIGNEFFYHNGNMLVPLHVVELLGATYEFEPETWRIRIQSESQSLTMHIANYQCANQAKLEKMPAKPTFYNNTVMIPIRYVAESLGMSVSWDGKTDSVYVSTTGNIPEEFIDLRRDDVENGLLTNKIIIVDPGHGGSDPGAVAGNIKEKDLNLQVAKILTDMLKEAGANVYMTRKDDRYVGLYTRAAIANNLNADLFISIHHNASSNSAAKGVMTLFYPSSKKQKMNGQKFAQIVQKNMVNDLNAPDWGIIARPNLVVTRETRMPAALAELGFMSTKSELERLVTYEFQEQAAKSLYKSIIEALKE
jgi:N-acetylmuramoyl-L-alanine amidase